MSKRTWARLLSDMIECRRTCHIWGARVYYGDASRERGGTHRCGRCGSVGVPDTPITEETP